MAGAVLDVGIAEGHAPPSRGVAPGVRPSEKSTARFSTPYTASHDVAGSSYRSVCMDRAGLVGEDARPPWSYDIATARDTGMTSRREGRRRADRPLRAGIAHPDPLHPLPRDKAPPSPDGRQVPGASAHGGAPDARGGHPGGWHHGQPALDAAERCRPRGRRGGDTSASSTVLRYHARSVAHDCKLLWTVERAPWSTLGR